jgi:hypothetical protein
MRHGARPPVLEGLSGDWPGLDRSSKSPLWGKRPLGASGVTGRSDSGTDRKAPYRGLCQKTPKVAQKLLVLFGIIGAVVFAPLSKDRAHAEAKIGAAECHFIAPLDEVVPIKDVIIVGPAPNENQRLIPDRVPTPINDGSYAWYLEACTGLSGIRADKEWDRRIPISSNDDITLRSAPINLNSHFLGGRSPAVPPFWGDSKTGDIEFWTVSVLFRQVLFFHSFDVFPGSDFRFKAVQIDEGALDLSEGAFGNFCTAVCGAPQFIRTSFQSQSECGDGDGRDGGCQRAPMIERRGESPSREEDYVVTATIIGGLFASVYLVLKGKIP